MKKTLSRLLAIVLTLALFPGSVGAVAAAPDLDSPDGKGAGEPVLEAVADERARPSVCGCLRVVDGKLCSESGEPVMLRGVSSNGLITAEDLINGPLFEELSRDVGVNLFRFAMYTYGVGIVGYCTNGDKDRHKQDIAKGVELCREADMYALIDWHILSDGDPNRYLEDAKSFFAETAERYRDYNNVLYEICNEPNGVDWAAVKRYAEEIISVIQEHDPDAVVIVGCPDWSKDLRSVASDPLGFDNILYTLHFYSATHGQEFRDMTEEVSQAGLPIFVTEFGVTASSGGLPRDLESADLWIDLLERENISWCMWSYSMVREACSALRPALPKYSGFTREDYSPTGQWLLDTLERYDTM